MKRLYECIKRKNANNSMTREILYKFLLDNQDKCLSVADIEKELLKSGNKSISLNTIYRQLDLFVSCNLVVTIQNNFKKSFYTINSNNPMFFTLCTNCNRVKKLQLDSTQYCNEVKDANFITIHKKCNECP